MPATNTTRETFPKATVTEDQVKKERDLRIRAGAIRSSFVNGGTQWVLTTEWNLIGSND